MLTKGWGQWVQPRSRRPGAALVMVAVSLIALMSGMALAIDIGMLFSARGEAQRAADSGALAGASAFTDNQITTLAAQIDSANTRAYRYATSNELMNTPILAAEVTVAVIPDSQKVRVNVRRTGIGMIFAKLFGQFFGTVGATAAAQTETAGTVTCVKPFAIPDMWTLPPSSPDDIYERPGPPYPIWDFDAHLNPSYLQGSPHCDTHGCDMETWTYPAGATYDRDLGLGTTARNGSPDYKGLSYTEDKGRRIPLKLDDMQSSPIPSYTFAWRMPDDAGTSDFIENLKGCVNMPMSVGDSVQREPGDFGNPAVTALIDLIDNGDGTRPADPGAYWDDIANRVVNSSYANVEASPRVITVPLVHPSHLNTSGMEWMEFLTFATFFLEDPRREYPDIHQLHKAPITGRFMGLTSGLAGPATDTIIRRLRLIE